MIGYASASGFASNVGKISAFHLRADAASCYNAHRDRVCRGRLGAMICRTLRIVGVVAGCLSAASLLADEPTAAERGKKALLEHCYSPPTITRHGFDNLWKQWGLEAKPSQAEFDRILRERYGLHERPIPTTAYRWACASAAHLRSGQGHQSRLHALPRRLHRRQELCRPGQHGLELQGFFEETGAADGHGRKTPFHFSNMRGTNEAGAHGRLSAGLPRPELGSFDARTRSGAARRSVRGRAGLVAAQEEEDDVSHRRHATRARCGRSCSS